MKKAFSLIELLVALIIISILTAVFLPIVNRQLTRNFLTLAGENLSVSCSIPNCEICSNDTECLLCSIGMPCATENIKTQDCSCLPCSNEGCLTCPNDVCTACKPNFGGVNCEACTEGTYSKGGSLALCGII